MSKPVKAVGDDTPAEAAEMPFEEALKRLNAIVEAMENEELPLEKLLTQYEEGVRLHQVCQKRLAAAEVRVQQIERDASGRVTSKPIEISNSNPKI